MCVIQMTGGAMCIMRMWQKLYFLVFFAHLWAPVLGYDLEEIEIDLRKKHGIENSTQITQETLQRIIAGAERGDRGKQLTRGEIPSRRSPDLFLQIICISWVC